MSKDTMVEIVEFKIATLRFPMSFKTEQDQYIAKRNNM